MILKIGNKVVIIAVLLSLFIGASRAEINKDKKERHEVLDSLSYHAEISILKQLEQPDSESNARVTVVNNTNVLFYKKENEMEKGYRIRLFFDNSQTARSQAEGVEELFKSLYPDQSVYMHYTTPYFNVTVGNYLTYQEALVFSKKILKNFPKAFIVPQDIPVSNLGTRIIIPEIDSTSVVLTDSTLTI